MLEQRLNKCFKYNKEELTLLLFSVLPEYALNTVHFRPRYHKTAPLLSLLDKGYSPLFVLYNKSNGNFLGRQVPRILRIPNYD